MIVFLDPEKYEDFEIVAQGIINILLSNLFFPKNSRSGIPFEPEGIQLLERWKPCLFLYFF